MPEPPVDESMQYTIDVRFKESPNALSPMVNGEVDSEKEASKYKNQATAMKGHMGVYEHIQAPDEKSAMKQACDKFHIGVMYEKTIHLFDCVNDEFVEHHDDGSIKLHCMGKNRDKSKITGFILRKGTGWGGPVVCGMGNGKIFFGSKKDCGCAAATS